MIDECRWHKKCIMVNIVNMLKTRFENIAEVKFVIKDRKIFDISKY